MTIGSVKVDLTKNERELYGMTFSDTKCIKYLIRARSKIDPYHNVQEDNYYDHAGIATDVNQEIICLYVTLDKYIEDADLNVKEKFVTNRLMEGYSVQDIADEFNRDRSNIYKTLNRVCAKIKNENDIAWKYDYMYLNYFKVPWQFKRCEMCKTVKPLTDDFFNRSQFSQDGFYNVCKEC